MRCRKTWMPGTRPGMTTPRQRLLRSDFPERHQAALRLVPQHEPYTPKALQQRDAADVAQFGMVAQHARQPVIGNAAAQMVHVVNADIGGEPAQQRRQVVVRAAVQRGLVQAPVLVVGPTSCPRTGAGRRTARRRRVPASSVIGRCTSRNALMPMSQISAATMTAIARLVAMVLTQGCQPSRIRPTGSRCCSMNR